MPTRNGKYYSKHVRPYLILCVIAKSQLYNTKIKFFTLFLNINVFYSKIKLATLIGSNSISFYLIALKILIYS